MCSSDLSDQENDPHFVGSKADVKLDFGEEDAAKAPALYPRQTPMLAGRVRSNGPYGWHAESADIVARLALGTSLHRGHWQSSGFDDGRAKLDYLMDYLRSGLLPPPTVAHALTDAEARGKAIFESAQARCSRCHAPATEFTDRSALPLPALPLRRGFDPEPNPAFKTPSLWFVSEIGRASCRERV